MFAERGRSKSSNDPPTVLLTFSSVLSKMEMAYDLEVLLGSVEKIFSKELSRKYKSLVQAYNSTLPSPPQLRVRSQNTFWF